MVRADDDSSTASALQLRQPGRSVSASESGFELRLNVGEEPGLGLPSGEGLCRAGTGVHGPAGIEGTMPNAISELHREVECSDGKVASRFDSTTGWSVCFNSALL